MSAFRVRLPDDVAKKPDALAAKPDRSQPDVAARAMGADIEAGLREAKKGDFASDAQVAATIARYTRRRPGK